MTAPFDLAAVKFDAQGLVPVVAQDALTGDVLMLAWANRDALEAAQSTGRMHYWSRSRAKLWRKGEESGHDQDLVRLALDCDGDAVLALVRQKGPACHTGTPTCFGRDADDAARAVLSELAQVIASRKASPAKESYTSQLLADPKKAGKKISEEATEVVMALTHESDQRVAEEAADVLYHLLVACAGRGVTLDKVLDVLAARRR